MFTLEIMGQVDLSTLRPIAGQPLIVGRDPECDIVVSHEAVSRRHAAVWLEGEHLWIEDLQSSNGVFVDDVRVEDRAELRVGQRIRLGSLDALRVRPRSTLSRARTRTFVLENADSGVRVSLDQDPITIGSGPTCAMRLPDGPAVAAVVVLQGEDEVWYGIDDEMHELLIGETFEVGAHTMRLTAEEPDAAATIIDSEPANWPYRVTVDRRAPGGMLVVVEAPARGARVELHATNTAALLYLLARAWQADEQARLAADRRGWLDDEAVASGVWGKDGPSRQLKVLVCRLRQEIRAGGLDPWFIEKRRGALRIRVVDVMGLD